MRCPLPIILALSTVTVLGRHELFTVEPRDVVFIQGQKILLQCTVEKAVNGCRWLRGGSDISLDSPDTRISLVGSPSNGDCSLQIHRPEIGQDTTFWQCLPVLEDNRLLESRPCRVIVREYTKRNQKQKKKLKEDEQALYVESNNRNGTKRIVLESLYTSKIRIRWFVDGKLTESKNDNFPNDNNKGSVRRSSISIHLTSKDPPVLVHCCVEKITDPLYKNVVISTIYVADDSYDVNEHRKSEMTQLPFKVIAPMPRLKWIKDGKVMQVNGNRVVIRTQSNDPPEFLVQCTDMANQSSTFLQWGVSDMEKDTDVVSDNYEFAESERTNEMISATVKFLKASRHMTIQCRAGSILYNGADRQHSATMTWRKDVCATLFSQAEKIRANSIITYSLVSFSVIIYIKLSTFFYETVI